MQTDYPSGFVLLRAAALRGVVVLGVGTKLYPFQVVAVHEGAGVCLAAGKTLALGGELHADRLHLLLEVEVFELLHAGAVQRVAEVAEALDVDALAHRHTGVHHAGDVAQHGLHVRITNGGNFRQILGDGFRFHRFALHDGLRIIHVPRDVELFFPERHNVEILGG